MISNFHTHTFRCLHAKGTEEDYIHAAKNADMKILGFSDHGPFPDKDFGYRMQFEELQDYVSELNRLKKAYSGQIQIFSGLEIEYHAKYNDYYKSLINESGLDYLLLGEHMYTASDGSIKNIFFAEKTDDYIEYAENISYAAETGLFNAIAHPDLMFINELVWDKNCEKACDIILSAAEKYKIPLEFNANGIRRGIMDFPDEKRFPYPHDGFWKNLSGSSQKVFIGADCHIPEQLDDSAIKLAQQMCKGLRLNVVDNILED